MDAKILYGKPVAEKIENNLKERITKTNNHPVLATIIVGNNPASETYVKMKINACKRVGIEPIKIALDESITTEELLSIINDLNNDSKVNGILIQHPLPKHIDENKCFNRLSLEKDVDGVNAGSFGLMTMNNKSYKSATPAAIMEIIKYYNIDVTGKNVTVVGRSAILGKPVAMMLLNENATVTICHSKTRDLIEHLKNADIIVAAVGKPKFIHKDWLKDGVIIIDAGYNKGNVGDVDLENASLIASAYTPVPGGIGPVTIAKLLEQTVESYESSLL